MGKSSIQKLAESLDSKVKSIAKKEASKKKYDIACPNCKADVTVPLGKSACPACNGEIDLIPDFKV